MISTNAPAPREGSSISLRYAQRYPAYRTLLVAWPGEPTYVTAISEHPRSSYCGATSIDQPQTIEQIIASGYFAVPAGDPITALVSDRTFTSKLGLDDMVTQIRERYQIWEHNREQIEISKLAAINAVHDWEALHGSVDGKQFSALHRTLQQLYQEQREERVNLWRDISRLREGLPPVAQEYLSAYRKQTLLEDNGGEGPC
jgi:hypothetical protein